jgi:hypothetical protein
MGECGTIDSKTVAGGRLMLFSLVITIAIALDQVEAFEASWNCANGAHLPRRAKLAHAIIFLKLKLW